MPKFCRCGCGTELDPDSRITYVMGHRKAMRERDAKDYVKSLKEKRGITEPVPEETFSDLGKTWETIQNPFEALQESLPNDPEPDQKLRDVAAGIISPDGTPVVTKQVAADVQGKVAFLLSMPASMLSTIDPVCFPVLLQQTPEISAKLTPIICQSPEMVKWFTKGSGFILWLNLAVSVWPVIQVVIAHHVTKTAGHDHQGNPIVQDFSHYRA